MSESESQEESQVQASDVPGGAPAVQEPSGKKGLLMIIILILVLAIIGGGGAAVFFLVFNKPDRGLVVVNPEDVKFIEEYNLRKQPSLDAIKPGREPVFSGLYPYTVNMRDGKHMMQITFRCLLYDDTAIEYLRLRRPQIDDAFLVLFKELRPEDLRNRAGLELLKIDILKTINSFFDQTYIDLSVTKDRQPVKEILIVDYYIN